MISSNQLTRVQNMFSFNFRDLVVNDVLDLLEQDYNDIRDDFEYTVENELFKYIGCREGKARYLIGFEDENNETYDVTVLIVEIGRDKLCCDFAAHVSFSSKIESEMLEYFEKRCN
jgi:hypothetical protein